MDKGFSNSRRMMWAILLSIPFVAITVYFKLTANDSIDEEKTKLNQIDTTQDIAIPNTTIAPDVLPVVEETIAVSVPDSMGTDRRPPLEAGDEDGYWDGWYDGAETGERLRYDESSRFRTTQDRETYAASYREGYEKGFEEAKSKRGTSLEEPAGTQTES